MHSSPNCVYNDHDVNRAIWENMRDESSMKLLRRNDELVWDLHRYLVASRSLVLAFLRNGETTGETDAAEKWLLGITVVKILNNSNRLTPKHSERETFLAYRSVVEYLRRMKELETHSKKSTHKRPSRKAAHTQSTASLAEPTFQIHNTRPWLLETLPMHSLPKSSRNLPIRHTRTFDN